MEVRKIELDRIGREDTQTLAALRPRAIAEYAEAIKAGHRMKPAVVFNDGTDLYLAAGFHRREAHRLVGCTHMLCWVRQGTKWDAIAYGIKYNIKHQGERLTNADRRHNIRLVLKEKPELTDSAIAQTTGTSPTTVGKYRAELESTFQIGKLEVRTGRDGRVIDTTNIGRRPSSVQPLWKVGEEESALEPRWEEGQ